MARKPKVTEFKDPAPDYDAAAEQSLNAVGRRTDTASRCWSPITVNMNRDRYPGRLSSPLSGKYWFKPGQVHLFAGCNRGLQREV